VTVALPVLSVVAVAVWVPVDTKVPQEPGVLGLPAVNVTRSLATGPPPGGPVTVAVTVDVLVPLAAMLEGLALTVMVFAVGGGGGGANQPSRSAVTFTVPAEL
jgi:hypothetical protein